MTYTTIQGDMWDSIAHKVYGSESNMVQLMQANPQHTTTTVFSAGVVLTVPSIPEPVDSSLPPWKRV
ncbi:tail protein X [Paenibacillus camelliae]|uniref:tail protein X n=1 Tax=Paenibacillus camelliae TaxID=512410 RepID=UPI00203E86E0|nr:tail protein X [Paenibacillus camelliae]